jgi:hypothetical protein
MLLAEQVRGDEFGMVSYGVCSAYLELDPQSPRPITPLQNDVCARGVAEQALQVCWQNRPLVAALPFSWELTSKLRLKVGREASHSAARFLTQLGIGTAYTIVRSAADAAAPGLDSGPGAAGLGGDLALALAGQSPVPLDWLAYHGPPPE